MLAILTYHSIDTSGSVVSVAPRGLAEHMAVLATLGFRGISLQDAVAHRDTTGSWPERCAVLTFDDGYANFYEEAFGVLRAHGFGATVFLVTGHVGGQNDWAPPPPLLGTRRLLSWEQVKTLAAAGVEIGTHTRTHADLRRLSAAQTEDEIVTSRLDIENRLGKPVVSFAYPFGNVSPAAREIVRREFRASCTTVLQRAGSDTAYDLPRIDMYYFRTRALGQVLAGRLDGYLTLRRWGRSLRGLLGRD